MSENLWRPRLESYLAVREAMGHSVRAERKLLGEFLDFADQKGGAGPIRAEWALDWACMLSPRRRVGGQAGRFECSPQLSNLPTGVYSRDRSASSWLAERPQPP